MKYMYPIIIMVTGMALLQSTSDSFAQKRAEIRKNSPSSDFKIYPNPNKGTIKVYFKSAMAGQGYISVFSNSGNPISKKRVHVMVGKNFWDQTLPCKSSETFLIEFKMDSIIRQKMTLTLPDAAEFRD